MQASLSAPPMATYAAYRHIELDKIGYGKKRVLKPPGGGSSDIFGTNGGGPSTDVASTPSRKVKNHQQSNFFLNDEPAFTPSKNQNGKDTHSRLFGTPPPTTPGKNRMRSNIVLNEDDNDNRNEQKGEQKTDINPDYTDGAHNGENGHTEEPAMNGGSVMNGNAAPPVVNGNSQPAPAQRQRVPPGGFSSGLW